MQMKVLFLDDDKTRQQLFRTSHFYSQNVGDIVETAEEAINALEEHSPYDIMSLDHDLGGKIFVASDEKSGYQVAKYIASMPKNLLPKKVILHTFNPAGARNMMMELNGIVPVVYKPFNLTNYE